MCTPAVSVTAPSFGGSAPCVRSWSMTTLPLIFSREPSSLERRNVCSPAVATVRFAKTCDWKLLLAPNSAVVRSATS